MDLFNVHAWVSNLWLTSHNQLFLIVEVVGEYVFTTNTWPTVNHESCFVQNLRRTMLHQLLQMYMFFTLWYDFIHLGTVVHQSQVNQVITGCNRKFSRLEVQLIVRCWGLMNLNKLSGIEAANPPLSWKFFLCLQYSSSTLFYTGVGPPIRVGAMASQTFPIL